MGKITGIDDRLLSSMEQAVRGGGIEHLPEESQRVRVRDGENLITRYLADRDKHIRLAVSNLVHAMRMRYEGTYSVMGVDRERADQIVSDQIAEVLRECGCDVDWEGAWGPYTNIKLPEPTIEEYILHPGPNAR